MKSENLKRYLEGAVCLISNDPHLSIENVFGQRRCIMVFYNPHNLQCVLSGVRDVITSSLDEYKTFKANVNKIQVMMFIIRYILKISDCLFLIPPFMAH